MTHADGSDEAQFPGCAATGEEINHGLCTQQHSASTASTLLKFLHVSGDTHREDASPKKLESLCCYLWNVRILLMTPLNSPCIEIKWLLITLSQILLRISPGRRRSGGSIALRLELMRVSFSQDLHSISHPRLRQSGALINSGLRKLVFELQTRTKGLRGPASLFDNSNASVSNFVVVNQ